MSQFKIFWKQRRGMPLITASDPSGTAHAVQNTEFPNRPAALEFVRIVVKQGGEAILMTAGKEKIAAGLELERLAFGR
jgi:hypothetical protein